MFRSAITIEISLKNYDASIAKKNALTKEKLEPEW